MWQMDAHHLCRPFVGLGQSSLMFAIAPDCTEYGVYHQTQLDMIRWRSSMRFDLCGMGHGRDMDVKRQRPPKYLAAVDHSTWM